MTDLYNLRRDFTLKALREADVNPCPLAMFEQWLQEDIQAEAMEPNAMTLSTVSRQGKPSSRIVLLKQVGDEGFVFFTNYDSRKAVQLTGNKHCALNFIWHELERQVRVEGFAEKIPAEESDRYFEVRPYKSKLGAWASQQSMPIPDREYLDEQMAGYENKYKDRIITRPANWGGYVVHPLLIEFWQGRSNRLHDRIQYTLTSSGTWDIIRLAP